MNIKILDCTIRDGGLVNKFDFSDEFVRGLYEACAAAGVDYMEIGYKGSKKLFNPNEFGAWQFCDEKDIRRIVGNKKLNVKLSVMADAEKTDYHSDILPKTESVIDMVRITTYFHQIPIAIDMIKDAHDKGYETAVNLMAVSLLTEKDIDKALRLFCDSEADVIYLVDSFGSLHIKQARTYASKYINMAQSVGKSVGIHAHNNQQLAFANTIESFSLGAKYLDTTVNGLGRGAGNCATELLLGYLDNPKYNNRAILEFIEKYIVPLRAQGTNWGYDIPYMITGMMNSHPRSAIEFLNANKKEYVWFYDHISEQSRANMHKNAV